MISVIKTVRFSSEIRPTEIPATGALMGTPASISAKQPAQTEAMDEEPLDSKISENTRMVYGKSFFEGSTARIALAAKAPWPISRRPGPRIGLVSPTLKEGKL